MDAPEAGCGPLYACYLAARQGDDEAMRAAWRDVETDAWSRGKALSDDLTEAVDDGDGDRVATLLEDRVFHTDPEDRLDGIVAQELGQLLWTVGYLAAFVLFFGADSRQAIVARLRWAYRTVGVDIRAIESVGDVERTVFQCPYRDAGASRWGQRRVCHDVLDRVDDGYVTFLDRHRDIEYDRPRPCAGGQCCYSEVTEQ